METETGSGKQTVFFCGYGSREYHTESLSQI